MTETDRWHRDQAQRQMRQMRRLQWQAKAMERASDITPRADAILRAVSLRFDVPVDDIKGRGRSKTVALARLAAYWLLWHRGLSYPEIGRAVGNRDHTTAMSGVRRVNEMRAVNATLAARLDALLTSLEVGPGVAKAGALVATDDKEALTG